MSDRPLEPERNGGGIRNGQPAAPPPPPAAQDFEELRGLLLGPEQESLRKLNDPEARLKEFSDALPKALAKRGPNDRLLASALRPTVMETVTQSIRRQPQFFADLLAPVIAPTIRRAIAQAFESTLQAIREMTSRTFSLQGIKWRLEAWRTGISVGEIALRQTLKYRVEQVFLIHDETGVLLQYVAIPGAPGPDSDMVSGMLSAIAQFMKDAFHDSSGTPKSIVMEDERRLWVERGTQVTIAATIRGLPPLEFRTVLQDTRDGIQTLQHEALAKFQGDTSAFDICRPELEACLRSESSLPTPRKVNIRIWKWAFAAIVGAFLAGLALGLWRARAERGRRTDLVRQLDAEPGLMTTGTDLASTPIKIRGLRDPLARDPGIIARLAGFPDGTIDARWEPFHSLHPALTAKRVARALEAPDGVTLRFADGTLHAEGSATHAWIETFERNARSVPGVLKLDDAGLIDSDLTRWRELAVQVESMAVRFDGASEGLGAVPRGDLARIATLAREAAEAGGKLGRKTQIEVTGEMFRASAVVASLASLNAPSAIIRVGPPKSGSPNEVSLRLQLLDSPPER